MERVHGSTLLQMLEERRKQQPIKPLTVKDILFISREIVRGMHYLHRHRILHRDLKSSNILIGQRIIRGSNESMDEEPFKVPTSSSNSKPNNGKDEKTFRARRTLKVETKSADTSLPLPETLVKICDFNTLLAPNTKAGIKQNPIGTVRWLAPEVC
jgi:serine/threonine protein kinase